MSLENLLNKISIKIINYLVDNKYLEHNNYNLYLYGIGRFLSNMIIAISLVLLGIFTGEMANIFIFLLLFVPLRKYAGGFHFNSAFVCFVSSIIAIYFAVDFAKVLYNSIGQIITSLVFFLIILCNTPVESKNKPLSYREKTVFKKKTIIILIIHIVIYISFMISNNFIICSLVLSSITLEGVLVLIELINNKLKEIYKAYLKEKNK
jgi:putative AIP processing-secretion protein